MFNIEEILILILIAQTVVGRVKWHRVFDTCVTEVSTPTFHEQGTVKFICVKTSLYVDI